MTATIDFNSTFESFITTLNRFTPAAFTHKPAPDSWSAAEVTEHICIINSNLIKVLGVKGETPDRPADKKLAAIVEALQDRQTKRAAPENVVPTGKQTDPVVLIATLQTQQEQLRELVTTADQQELCTVYPHPRLGRLTRMEWFHFIAAHTERHRLQLEEIAHKIDL